MAKTRGRNESKTGISEIDPKLVMPDPENVRREGEEEIEADESFQRLKESVYTYGVLVPLVVKPYKDRQKKYQFILVDGERRLRAALATNLDLVPVHILKEAEIANQMLYAFQIHMLRKEWSRPAQARALLKIMRDIRKKEHIRAERKLFPILQERTGYGQNKLRDLLRVLRYVEQDEAILDGLEDTRNNIKFSHLVQLEASFVEQVQKHFPDIVDDYGLKTIRHKLVEKVRREVIATTREPIEELLPLFVHAANRERRAFLKKLLKEFLENPDKSPEEVNRTFELRFPSDREDLVKLVGQAKERIEGLQAIVRNLNFIQLRAYKSLREGLRKQVVALVKVLRNAVDEMR
jgi:ParB/RepB/Spo0J family partition protein